MMEPSIWKLNKQWYHCRKWLPFQKVFMKEWVWGRGGGKKVVHLGRVQVSAFLRYLKKQMWRSHGVMVRASALLRFENYISFWRTWVRNSVSTIYLLNPYTQKVLSILWCHSCSKKFHMRDKCQNYNWVMRL